MTKPITTTINKEFLIRITDEGGQTHLVGAGQLFKWVGIQTANKLFRAALKSSGDTHTRKLRRGLKIEFCSK